MSLSLLLLALALGPGTTVRTLHVQGAERSYIVHVPPGLPTPAPVVLAFHGGLGSGAQMEEHTGLDATADAHRFVAVYPNGSGRLLHMLTWNAGAGCCGYAATAGVDDVAFVRALLDDLGQVLPVDPRRIYATGMSNGAVLTYRLAAELPVFAAIGPVAGAREVDMPAVPHPVPIVHFHGTADEHIPMAGGRGPRALVDTAWRSLKDTLTPWLAANGCQPKAEERALPDLDPADGTRVTRWSYPGCRADVVVYAIEGGGHSWPGSTAAVARQGKVTRDISANELLWQFFAEHPRPESTVH